MRRTSRVQWGLYDPEKGWQRPKTDEEVERERKRNATIIAAYNKGHVIQHIADSLNIGRATVYRVLRKYDLPLRQPKNKTK